MFGAEPVKPGPDDIDAAATALHNASLLMAERKVEVLETLVTVSHEITSTLHLERMLQTIVSAPQAVIPYERAAIALHASAIGDHVAAKFFEVVRGHRRAIWRRNAVGLCWASGAAGPAL